MNCLTDAGGVGNKGIFLVLWGCGCTWTGCFCLCILVSLAFGTFEGLGGGIGCVLVGCMVTACSMSVGAETAEVLSRCDCSSSIVELDCSCNSVETDCEVFRCVRFLCFTF